MDVNFKELKDIVAPAALAAPYKVLGGGDEAVVVADGYRVHTRVALPVRRHTFGDPRSLAMWLRREAVPQIAEVLVGESAVHATTDGRATDSDRVCAPLVIHPRLARWVSAFGQVLDQRALARLLSSANGDIPEGLGTKLHAAVLSATWSGTANVKLELDSRGFVKATGSDSTTTINCEFPSQFRIVTPVFIGAQDATGGEPVYDISIAVEIEATPKGVTFKLAPMNLEIVRLQARLDLRDQLARLLDDQWLVGLGEIAIEHVTTDPEARGRMARHLGVLDDRWRAGLRERPESAIDSSAEPAR